MVNRQKGEKLIITKDHVSLKIMYTNKLVFWERKLQNISLVSGNKEQAITLLIDTFLTN